MKDTKTILYLVGDIYMSGNPNFFYQQVVYFPVKQNGINISPVLSLADIFVDQIDMKLVEEQSDEQLEQTMACFFFKN
jgi:hypothetical protein